jgi:hypothetical protein
MKGSKFRKLSAFSSFVWPITHLTKSDNNKAFRGLRSIIYLKYANLDKCFIIKGTITLFCCSYSDAVECKTDLSW